MSARHHLGVWVAEPATLATDKRPPVPLTIVVEPPPKGFGPWQLCDYREWKAAKADGLPTIELEQTYDDQFKAVYWVAHHDTEAGR